MKDSSIFIKNIYYMLSYAFVALRQSTFENIATEKFENIHNLFAAILSKGISQQLKQGLYREYNERKENLITLQGKIDMAGTFQNRMARKHLLTCDYDELSENNLLNQILKTTTMLLLRHPQVATRYRDTLKKEMMFFSNVENIEPSKIKWATLHFHRNNQIYQLLIGICQLILEGMLLTTDPGKHHLASFVDEQRMNRLYEKFVLEYYRKKFPQLHAIAAQIPWALDDGEETLLPTMQSDITLTFQQDTLIIDTKYYACTTQVRYGKRKIHSNNLYQIFTYVKNKDSQLTQTKVDHTPVSGLLLYAKTDEEIQPDSTYTMSGNQIGVRTLDLNQEFSLISSQLDEIVHQYFAI